MLSPRMLGFLCSHDLGTICYHFPSIPQAGGKTLMRLSCHLCRTTSIVSSRQEKHIGEGVEEAGFALSVILSLLSEHKRMLFALLYPLPIAPPCRKAETEFCWHPHHLHALCLPTADTQFATVFTLTLTPIRS